jgi:ATP-dependent DNA helicase 2 subunit 2
MSGLDIDALLGSNPKRQRTISASNAIPEFKQALAASDDMGLVRDATQQMGAIIEDFIRASVGDSAYGKALESLRIMREELVDLEEPEMYNEFVGKLKKKILKGELGGERREMWWKIRTARLGLVDSSMSEVSKVTDEEAKEFYKASS